MSETNGANSQAADIGRKLQELLASHEMVLSSQETLLGGYQALYGAIRSIIEANAKKNFLSEKLKQDLYEALDASNDSLNIYLENVRKAKDS